MRFEADKIRQVRSETHLLPSHQIDSLLKHLNLCMTSYFNVQCFIHTYLRVPCLLSQFTMQLLCETLPYLQCGTVHVCSI